MSGLEATFLRQLQERLDAFFREQAEGWDIPPAHLYRLEGFIEAGLRLELISRQQVRRQLLALADHYLCAEDADLYRQDEDIVLHLHMKTAPVYPGNSSST